MSANRTRPTSIVLDMLRSARSRQRTARSLVAAGELFGHSANTMRVTLSRLMSRGLIESPKRGLYRLSSATDALNGFVERWRNGESRVTPWDGTTWLFAHHAKPNDKDLWALEAVGFKAVRPGLHTRPDNLAESLKNLKTLAVSIGLDPSTLIIQGHADCCTDGWQALWEPDALESIYDNALQRLTESARNLTSLPPQSARLECFRLGGEVIHRLAKDPLLPDSWIDTGKRRALWRAMLAYDAQGKDIWAASREESLRHMPHPELA